MSNTRRMTQKGQVTIPQEIREQLGLRPYSEVEFEMKNGVAFLRKAKKSKDTLSRGSKIIERMKGSATVKMTTDEILKLTRG